MKFFRFPHKSAATGELDAPSKAVPLETLPIAGLLQIPLATKPLTGTSAEPRLLHAIQSEVSGGDLLANRLNDGSPAVLAPVDGTIVGISRITLLNGHTVPAVNLQPHLEQKLQGEEYPEPTPEEPPKHQHSPTEPSRGPDELPAWIARLADAGIWADRRSSPDLLGQLFAATAHPVDTVICNLLDDEPTMRLSGTLAARTGSKLAAGLRLMARLTGARRTLIVTDSSSPSRWYAPLKKLIRDDTVSFVPLINDYPQSDPTMLLLALLARRLKPTHLPIEQRVLLLDAASAIAIGRAVVSAQPMLQVPFAIRDHIRRRSRLLMVPIGTPVLHVLEQVGAPTENVTYRRGDVLHENEISHDAVISGADLTLHVIPRQLAVLSDPCIRCSWCIESCPTGIQPAGLLEAAQSGNQAMARHYGIDACIECGVCSYVCPSRLPLLTGIRSLKNKH